MSQNCAALPLLCFRRSPAFPLPYPIPLLAPSLHAVVDHLHVTRCWTRVGHLRVTVLVRWDLGIHREGVPVGVWNLDWWGAYVGFSVRGLFGSCSSWLVCCCL